MNKLRINDVETSHDGQFLFKIIDEGTMGRGVMYLAQKASMYSYCCNAIPANTNIAEFVGKVITWNPEEPDTSANNSAFEYQRSKNVDYLIALNRTETKLLIPGETACVAFLVNTKQGANNCRLSISGNRAFIKTTRRIHANTIIYLSYGASFTRRLNSNQPCYEPEPAGPVELKLQRRKIREVIHIHDSDSDIGSDTELEESMQCPQCEIQCKNKKELDQHKQQAH